MAWPSSPLTSYVPGTTPVIHAFDLNAMQSGTNGLVNGTYNVQALTTTTSTPGTVITPIAGTVVAAAALGGSSTPNTNLPQGTLARGLVPVGWACITSAGNLTQGYNVFAAPGMLGGGTHPVAGQFYTTFNIASAGIANGVALVTHSDMIDTRFVASSYLSLGGKAAVEVLIRDSGGTPVDTTFQVLLFAE